MADIKDLDEERKKRAGKQKPKDDERFSKSELFYHVIAKMNRTPLAPADWPVFPRTFHYIADRIGRKAVLEELEGETVVYRDRDVVADAVLRYCWSQIPFVPGAGIDAEGAAKCRNMWLGLTPALAEDPRVLSEKSQPGLTFKRLPFDAPPSTTVVPPQFEKLLGRFSKPSAVCAFIGSLFYPEADRQQYLYLHGAGGDSKGTLMRFLQSIFGDAAQALSVPGSGDKRFWNFGIYGKRLGLFFDIDATEWFGSAHFKSLVGGDPQFFEEKGRMGFTATPTVKCVSASNFKPKVSGGPANMRRLIYVDCKPVPDAERQSNFESVLLEEAPAIISTCKAIYLELCPSHGPIPCEIAEDVALAQESRYLDVFYEHFQLGDCELRGMNVRALLHKSGVSDQKIDDLKDVWTRVLGVEIGHDERGTYYRGMGLKSFLTTVTTS